MRCWARKGSEGRGERGGKQKAIGAVEWLWRAGAAIYIGAVLKSDPESWSDPRHRLGARAEQLAAELLERGGWTILEQRYRYHRHDVDLIARQGAVVAFVEVKARLGRSYGAAALAVTAHKQRELTRAAASWLQRHGRPGDVARFDVVTVEGGSVAWIENAFRPGWR